MKQVEDYMRTFKAEELFPTHPQKVEILEALIDNILNNVVDVSIPIAINTEPEKFAMTVDGDTFDSNIIMYAGLINMAFSQSPQNPFVLKFGVDLNGLRHYVEIEEISNFYEDEVIIEVWWK